MTKIFVNFNQPKKVTRLILYFGLLPILSNQSIERKTKIYFIKFL